MEFNRYRSALSNIPAPGCGCHTYLLSLANRGVRAGLDPERMFSDIRRSIPTGTRRIPDREIEQAIRKAIIDHHHAGYRPIPRPSAVVKDGKAVLQKIIAQARITHEADLWESSPVRLWQSPEHDPVLLLETLFSPCDLLWIGEKYEPGVEGETIRKASDWITYFENGGKIAPHIMINPLTGKPVPKKDGKGQTLRGDGNVASFRHALVEFDNLSMEEQIRFWSAVKLPIVALITSGGKSIHAWVDVQKLSPAIDTLEQWQTVVKGRWYDQRLTPMGVDPAGCNPAPGVWTF
jgi:hypothetical protein